MKQKGTLLADMMYYWITQCIGHNMFLKILAVLDLPITESNYVYDVILKEQNTKNLKKYWKKNSYRSS